MFRQLFCFGILVLVLFVFVPATCVLGQGLGIEENVTPAFAVSVAEKELLIGKTETVLKWFRSLNSNDKQRLSFKDFRSKISPLELMQAAAILKHKEQPDMARMVREILPYLQPTNLECFEIQERLGTQILDSFQEDRELLTGDTPDSTTRIKNGATRFLKDSLNPAEKMALYREPQTPAEIMKVVDLLAIAGRPVVIRYYLRKFLDANAEPSEYAHIAESLGSPKLLQIANNKDFQPHGSTAVAKIYAEAKKYWQDEQVIAESLEDWQAPQENSNSPKENSTPQNFAQNSQPLHALWKGNKISLALLVQKLAENNDQDEINKILAVILSFSTEGRECLAAALQSNHPALVFNAAQGLAASIHAEETFLLYPALLAESVLSNEQRNQITEQLLKRGFKLPNKENAAAELLKRSGDYLAKKRSLKPDFDGFVRFWNWDDKEKNIKYIRMILPAAYRFFAYRYAAQAYRIQPEIHEIQRFYLLTLFERTAHLNGLDLPLDTNATGLNKTLADTEPNPKQQQTLLQQILLDAIAKEHYAAAGVAATLLGISKNRELLQPAQDGKPCPLVQAVVAKDRRLRFAALEAIMTLQPETPYAGSSFVAESLVWFSRADGQSVLISAHPKLSNAAKTAGFFNGCGYRGELAQTCRDAMKLAVETPDTEIVVVDSLTPEPTVAQFVQEMRNDPRTADIPIAVLTDMATSPEIAPDFQNRSDMQKIDQLQPNAPFALSLSRIYPHVVNDDGAKWLNEDLFGKTNALPVPTTLRIKQAHKALGWLKTIVGTPPNAPKIYHFEELEDTVFRALRSDVRIKEGLELAAVIKSGAVQAAIYDVAANSLHPIDLRRKAADAFGKSVDAFGVLLRGQQIQHLYDRYNASEFEPKETQELLGNLIDLVETHTPD